MSTRSVVSTFGSAGELSGELKRSHQSDAVDRERKNGEIEQLELVPRRVALIVRSEVPDRRRVSFLFLQRASRDLVGSQPLCPERAASAEGEQQDEVLR